jgi:uncharacterized protein
MTSNKELERYILDEIVPEYAEFDSAHREDHAMTVIKESICLADGLKSWIENQESPEAVWNEPLDRDMLFTAAACHDLGLVNGREQHHLDSGKIIRNALNLKRWFTEAQIEVIAQAAEDHRASSKCAPRSIYGMIVAEADRIIDAETIIRRTIQFGFKHYPGFAREEHIQRAVDHLREKYGRGGYLKLWVPWSENSKRLSDLQDVIADAEAVMKVTSEMYDRLTK